MIQAHHTGHTVSPKFENVMSVNQLSRFEISQLPAGSDMHCFVGNTSKRTAVVRVILAQPEELAYDQVLLFSDSKSNSATYNQLSKYVQVTNVHYPPAKAPFTMLDYLSNVAGSKRRVAVIFDSPPAGRWDDIAEINREQQQRQQLFKGLRTTAFTIFTTHDQTFPAQFKPSVIYFMDRTKTERMFGSMSTLGMSGNTFRKMVERVRHHGGWLVRVLATNQLYHMNTDMKVTMLPKPISTIAAVSSPHRQLSSSVLFEGAPSQIGQEFVQTPKHDGRIVKQGFESFANGIKVNNENKKSPAQQSEQLSYSYWNPVNVVYDASSYVASFIW